MEVPVPRPNDFNACFWVALPSLELLGMALRDEQ
jgi:hypothetical protein